MPKQEIREDTHAWIFAAHLYVLVVGAFVFAIGLDIREAIRLIGQTYAV